MFNNLLSILKGIVNGPVKLTEYELGELENIFAILTYPTIAGFPIVPTYISMRLLPYIEKKL